MVAKRTQPADSAWSDYAGELATNLRRLRQEAGLSQEDVAYRSDGHTVDISFAKWTTSKKTYTYL